MAASLTRLCTSGPRPFAIAAASIAVIVVARWMPGPAAPRATAEVSTVLDVPDALLERRAAVHGGSTTATITEVIEQPGYCGMFASFGQVRYGDQFGVVVPCMKSYSGEELRFAIGDTHTVSFDEQHRVTAITWQGKTWRFTHSTITPQGKICRSSSGLVMTPASAIGHLSGGELVGRGWHYAAPNWSWADPPDPVSWEACMEFLSVVTKIEPAPVASWSGHR